MTQNNGVIAHKTATMPDGMRHWAAAALTDATVVNPANARIRTTPAVLSRGSPVPPATSRTARKPAPTSARHMATSPGEKAVSAISVIPYEAPHSRTISAYATSQERRMIQRRLVDSMTTSARTPIPSSKRTTTGTSPLSARHSATTRSMSEGATPLRLSTTARTGTP